MSEEAGIAASYHIFLFASGGSKHPTDSGHHSDGFSRIVVINFTFVASAVSKELAVTLQRPGDLPIYNMKLGIRQISASNFQVTFINSIVFPICYF